MNWLWRLLRSLSRPQTLKPMPPTPPVDGGPPSTDLVAILNETRARSGLPRVWEDEGLDEASKVQADHQARLDTCTHGGPLDQPTTVDRLKKAGAYNPAVEWGEICAMGQRAYWPDGSLAIDYDFRKTCQDWLTSPGHKAILLGREWTHAGAYSTSNAQGRIYSTAVFARRSA